MLTFFLQLFLSFGLLIVYLLGSFPTFKYYDSALTIAGLAALMMLLIIPAPETPRWLLVHGERSRAIASLRLLRGKATDVNAELCEIENDILRSSDQKYTKSFRMFLSRTVLFPLFIVICAQIFQQSGGMIAATAYTASIFKSAGVKDYRSTSTYACGATQIVATIIAAFIVDTFGRKLLLITSGVGGFIATLMLGVHFYITRPSLCAYNINSTSVYDNILSTKAPDIDCNSQFAPLAIVSLMLYYVAFTIGWGPVPGILLGELLPLRVRGVASGMASFLSWSFATLVSGTYLDFTELIKPWFVWWGYSLINLASVIFVIVFVFETKGKSLEQIEERFRSKKCTLSCSCMS